MAMSVVYSNFCGMVVSETRGGVESDYVHDTLGSTIGLMDNTGTMTDRWEYWPLGEVVSHSGSNPTPLTFLGILGYFKDVLDKLFYVRARHLRADAGRWVTTDPTWPTEPAYVYASNSPTIYADPSGLDASLYNVAKKLASCCSVSYSLQTTNYYTFGIFTESVTLISICMCCCDSFWATIAGSGAVGGALVVLGTGVLATLGAVLTVIGGLIALAYGLCWLLESTEKVCVGYKGVLTSGIINSLVGSASCC